MAERAANSSRSSGCSRGAVCSCSCLGGDADTPQPQPQPQPDPVPDQNSASGSATKSATTSSGLDKQRRETDNRRHSHGHSHAHSSRQEAQLLRHFTALALLPDAVPASRNPLLQGALLAGVPGIMATGAGAARAVDSAAKFTSVPLAAADSGVMPLPVTEAPASKGKGMSGRLTDIRRDISSTSSSFASSSTSASSSSSPPRNDDFSYTPLLAAIQVCVCVCVCVLALLAPHRYLDTSLTVCARRVCGICGLCC
jgi:hypothetical protein